jgi:hypothetical protein
MSFLHQIESVNKYPFNYRRIMQIAYTDPATDDQTESSVLLSSHESCKCYWERVYVEQRNSVCKLGPVCDDLPY